MVADVIDAARHKDAKKRMVWAEGGDDVAVSPTDLESVWYVRVEGTLEAVKAAFPDCALLPRAGAPENEFAFLTPSMTRSALDSQLAGLKPCSVFRVLD